MEQSRQVSLYQRAKKKEGEKQLKAVESAVQEIRKRFEWEVRKMKYYFKRPRHEVAEGVQNSGRFTKTGRTNQLRNREEKKAGESQKIFQRTRERKSKNNDQP